MRAKSINDAIRQGVQLLRQHNVIGATVLTAERIKRNDIPVRIISKPDNWDEIKDDATALTALTIGARTMPNWNKIYLERRAIQSKHQPLKANTIVNIIKKGK